MHIVLHFLVPLLVAWAAYRLRWRQAYAWLLAGLIIDLDHLLANPIYDPSRCSIGFHPMHTTPAILIYVALLAHPKTRLLGLGLCIHIILDAIDCQLMMF